MSRSINIDNILNSDEKIFKDILAKIDGNIISLVRGDLESKVVFNTVLYDSIDFSISKLYEEENFLSSILYKTFGIGEEKNHRRHELIVFGSQLMSEISSLKREIKVIQFHRENLDYAINNLTELSASFGRKIHFLVKPNLQKKCNKYLKDTYRKLDQANKYKKELDLKFIYLESCIFKYNKLLIKIPRYKLIREEKYLGYNNSSS